MATPCISLVFLFLLFPTVLAMATPHENITPYQRDCPQQNETHLLLYMHQFAAIPNDPTPNEVNVIKRDGVPFGFGLMYVHDWTITTVPNPNDKIVGRLLGVHIQADQTAVSFYISHILVFKDGRFSGSTLEVLGIIDEKQDGEWSIMGGTGEFTKAQGSIDYRNINNPGSFDGIKELDIHVFYSPKSPTSVIRPPRSVYKFKARWLFDLRRAWPDQIRPSAIRIGEFPKVTFDYLNSFKEKMDVHAWKLVFCFCSLLS